MTLRALQTPAQLEHKAIAVNLTQNIHSLDGVQLNRVSDLMQEAGLPHIRVSALITG
jgi:hypothetical protein